MQMNAIFVEPVHYPWIGRRTQLTVHVQKRSGDAIPPVNGACTVLITNTGAMVTDHSFVSIYGSYLQQHSTADNRTWPRTHVSKDLA